MPCPLCILGFPEPHTKEDWARFRDEPELHDRLREIRRPIVEAQHKHYEETGELICG